MRAVVDLMFVTNDHALGLQAPEHIIPYFGAHVEVGDVGRGLQQMLRRGIAEHLAEGRVDGDKIAGGRGLENAILSVLEDGAVVGFGLAHTLQKAGVGNGSGGSACQDAEAQDLARRKAAAAARGIDV